MTLELTRLSNLLMERIRERVFDYHIDEGVFVIDSTDSEKTEYRNSEKSVSPYPVLTHIAAAFGEKLKDS